MGRQPKEPTAVIGVRLAVKQIEALDNILADKSLKWPHAGVFNRTDLIRYLINEGIESRSRNRR